MKTLDELLLQESSWPVITDMMARASNQFEILEKSEEDSKEALIGLQQSVASLMGAITYETGGIFIDNGWLRILGGGHKKLTRTIANWNLGRSHDSPEETPGFMMVADDVLGGIFAINGTELGDDTGNMYYLAPDTLDWEPMEVTFHEFLEFCFVGQVDKFYENLRWEGWQDEVAKIDGDQAITIIPPLWAEGPEKLEERDRLPIPMDESYDIALEMNNMLYEEEELDELNSSDCGDGCGCDHDGGDCCGGGQDDDEGSCGCGCDSDRD